MYKKLYNYIPIFLCCLLLSSCSGVSFGSPQATPAPTPASWLIMPKSDANGIYSEAQLRDKLAKVQAIINGMSLEEKLGQLIIVEFVGKGYTPSLQEMIVQQHVGGFMYQEINHNFDPPYNIEASVQAQTAQAMKDAHIPLLIATDQEGGLVNRLYKFHGPLPSAAAMSATGNPDYARNQGTQAAKWLLELGINADLAPVVDVQTIDPPVLGSRMFGRTPQSVVTYAGGYLDGLQKNGVIGTLKHFPGLGASTSDPHAGLPTVNRSKADLDKIDLAPYKLMIQQNHPAMIMSTDVLNPAIDPTMPAELSPKAINGVLRGELGYEGVVITDGLYMGGISQKWNIGQASVLAIIAGNDLIEGPFTPAQVASVEADLKQAVQDHRLSIDRINQSLQRILLMKMAYGILK